MRVRHGVRKWTRRITDQRSVLFYGHRSGSSETRPVFEAGSGLQRGRQTVSNPLNALRASYFGRNHSTGRTRNAGQSQWWLSFMLLGPATGLAPSPLLPSTTRSSPHCNLWCPSLVAFWQDARSPEPARRPGVSHFAEQVRSPTGSDTLRARRRPDSSPTPSGSVAAPGGPPPTVSLGFGAGPPQVFRGAAGSDWPTPHTRANGQLTLLRSPLAAEPLLLGGPAPALGEGPRGKAHQLDWKGWALARTKRMTALPSLCC